MYFSVVIPVYNEASRIPQTIASIFTFFDKIRAQHRVDIVFVNDGSTDTTERLLQEYQTKYLFEYIGYAKNQGKGYAVRAGALAARGEWVVFFDIDLATPLTEFNHLLEFLAPTDAVIIGSRRLNGSIIKKGESKLRTFLGHGFTKFSNLLVPAVTDFTCGFKCFSRAATAVIFPRARINRWGFDTELLYIARLKKLSLREMPVSWAHDDDSRVKVGAAIISSLKELGQMFFNRLRGYYR